MKKFFLACLILIGGSFLISFSGAEASAKRTLKNAIVKEISQSAKTLTVIKDGSAYAVSASSAKIRKGSSGSKSIKYSKIKKGDVVNIEGSFDDNNITATKVWDLSYNNKKTVTFYGVVYSLKASAKIFKINTFSRKRQTVTVLDSTVIENDDDIIDYSDLAEDDKVLIRGTWSESKKTITKTNWIRVLNDDDYEDLDI